MGQLSSETLPILLTIPARTSQYLKTSGGYQDGGGTLNNSVYPIYFDNIKNKYFIVDDSIRKDITINGSSNISVPGYSNTGKLVNNSGADYTLPPGSTTIPINASIQPTSTTSLYNNISVVVVQPSTPAPPPPPSPPPSSIPVLANNNIIELQPIVTSLKYLDGLGISTTNNIYNDLINQFRTIANFDYFRTYVLPTPSLGNLPQLTNTQIMSLQPIVNELKRLEGLGNNTPDNLPYSINLIQFKNIAGFNYFREYILSGAISPNPSPSLQLLSQPSPSPRPSPSPAAPQTLSLQSFSPETRSEIIGIINQINYLALPASGRLAGGGGSSSSGGSLSPVSSPAAVSVASTASSPSPSPSSGEDLFDKFRRITGMNYSRNLFIPLTQNQVSQLQNTIRGINDLKNLGFNIRSGLGNNGWLGLMGDFLNKARFDYYDGFVLPAPTQGIPEPPPRELTNITPLQTYYLRPIIFSIKYLEGHGYTIGNDSPTWLDRLRKFRAITGFDYTTGYVVPPLSVPIPRPDKLTEEQRQQLIPVMIGIFNLILIHGPNLQGDEYELDRFNELQEFKRIAGYSYYTGFVLPPRDESTFTDSEKKNIFDLLFEMYVQYMGISPHSLPSRNIGLIPRNNELANAFYTIFRRDVTLDDVMNKSRYHKEYLDIVQNPARVAQLTPLVIAINDYIKSGKIGEHGGNHDERFPRSRCETWFSYLHEFRIRAGFELYGGFTLPGIPPSTAGPDFYSVSRNNQQSPGTIPVTIATCSGACCISPAQILYLLPPNPVITPLAVQNITTPHFNILANDSSRYIAFLLNWTFDKTVSAADHFMIHYGQYTFGPVDYWLRSYEIADVPSNYTANLYITTHLGNVTTNSQTISVTTPQNIPPPLAPGSPNYPGAPRLSDRDPVTTSSFVIQWSFRGRFDSFNLIYGPYRFERVGYVGPPFNTGNGWASFSHTVTGIPAGYTNTVFIDVNLRDEAGVNRTTRSVGLVVSTLAPSPPPTKTVNDLTLSELNQLRTAVTRIQYYTITLRVPINFNGTGPEFNSVKSTFRTILGREYNPTTDDANILNNIDARITALTPAQAGGKRNNKKLKKTRKNRVKNIKQTKKNY